MADAVLIATTAVFGCLVVAAALYFLVYFQHPDDKWVAWLPKLVVVLGFSLACYNIFLLPLDVANQKGQFAASGGLPMKELWLAFFSASTVLVLVVVPFTIFYYEGEEDDGRDGESRRRTSSQVIYALKWLIPMLVLCGGLVGTLWWFVGTAEVTVIDLVGNLVPGTDYMRAQLCSVDNPTLATCSATRVTLTLKVSVMVYLIALTTLFGWVLLAFFGGVGLAALPFDLLMGWKMRPRPLKTEDYLARKKAIGEKAAAMMAMSETIAAEVKEANSAGSRSGKRLQKARALERKFRKDVLILEYHFQRMEDAYRKQGGDFLLQLACLLLGCIGVAISLTWIIHICIYLIPQQLGLYPIDPFLNSFFSAVSTVPFVGIGLYALWSFWLLACVIKGNTKVGMRLLFIPVHEMKIGQTLMSSLIFNAGLILLCSLAVAQFCTLSFASYAKYTTSASLFAVQMVNLTGITYIYKALAFALAVFAGLCLIYMIYRPPHKEMALERLKW
ncbi:LMBR1-like membrane protein-domain-containing protein [Hyaloraphidium curvatum]|nr:LMBR1-like membrane protein-domain-containing protein [Hyaloraphidium curvatum]